MTAELLTANSALAGPASLVVRDPTLPVNARALDFEIGRALFNREWAPAASAAAEGADGLGPLFDANSCNTCHAGGGRGVAYDAKGAVLPSLLFRLGPQDDPVYGQQIQIQAVAGLAAEGRATVAFEEHTVTLKDGTTVTLRKPVPLVADLAYGPLAPATVISPRLATAMNGIGLLERIPAEEILARADPDDRDRDGISGRPNMVTDPATGKAVLGRFGWKAGQPSFEGQDGKALDLDIGLSNPRFHDAYGDCTAAEAKCLAMPNGASPDFEGLEVPSSLSRLIDRFVREAMLPAANSEPSGDVVHGREVFMSAGCEACHRAAFQLPADGDLPARSIAPFTDLLLHDMGDGLADRMPEGVASGSEWRTAPLWGIGIALRAKAGVTLLHDGRARSVLEAILWHDGEAAKSRQRVEALSATDRQALIDFIGSL